MTEHIIKIFDYRPIRSKNTKQCIKCYATGRDITKYKTCEKYKQHEKDERKEAEDFMDRQDKLKETMGRK